MQGWSVPSTDPITVKCNSEGREPRESFGRKLENFVPVVFQRVKEDMRDRKRERASLSTPVQDNYLSSSNALIPEISINEIIELKQVHIVYVVVVYIKEDITRTRLSTAPTHEGDVFFANY